MRLRCDEGRIIVVEGVTAASQPCAKITEYQSTQGAFMYPEIMIIPMREELTRLGIKEARTAEEVDRAVAQPGTTMIVVNSVCGCAAGRMRPAVRVALQSGERPTHAITVFAGQDKEATERARSYFTGYAPSSPSIGLLRDGQLVYMMQRSDIEHREAVDIASELRRVFDKFCSNTAVSSN
jgi:putative YphP/YqiW family bacilliredoxin